MRTEQFFNRRFLGFQSPRGWYHWTKTVINGIFKAKGVALGDRVWCLRHGFTANALAVYGQGLRVNYRSYLSNKQYYSLHPINGQYSFWIDDKLTMKYVFSKYNEFLPNYYFQINDNGMMRLSDCQRRYETSVEGIMKCLDDVKVLALKRMYGSCGIGFYKLEKLEGDTYKITDESATREDVIKLLESLKGYLVQEYIINHNVLHTIWPGATNTVRVLMANVDSAPVLMRSFIRFGNAQSKGVDNRHAGGIEAVIDEANGRIVYAYAQDDYGVPHQIMNHPDSGKSFDVVIPHWGDMISKLCDICVDFPQLCYLGFDVAVTETGFKILEINSLSGLVACQLIKPLLADEKTRMIYEKFGLKLDKRSE